MNKEKLDLRALARKEITRVKEELRKILLKTKDWEEVYYFEESIEYMLYCCAFLQLAEEEAKGSLILSVEELKEITGYKDYIEEWGETNMTLGNIYIIAREYSYEEKLFNKLREGAKYENLIEETPTKNNLPDNWETWNGRKKKRCNQHKVILTAINEYFNLDEALRPALRDIAKEIEAPYSIILEAYKLYKK